VRIGRRINAGHDDEVTERLAFEESSTILAFLWVQISSHQPNQMRKLKT
jgi:hypothetical protein